MCNKFDYQLWFSNSKISLILFIRKTIYRFIFLVLNLLHMCKYCFIMEVVDIYTRAVRKSLRHLLLILWGYFYILKCLLWRSFSIPRWIIFASSMQLHLLNTCFLFDTFTNVPLLKSSACYLFVFNIHV